MRRFDKKHNIEKANLLAEQRYYESKGTKLNEGTTQEEREAFYNRVNDNDGPHKNWLEKAFKNPNFELRFVKDGGVKTKKTPYCTPHKCETNTFDFIRMSIENDDDRYYPVSGWIFYDDGVFYEHFWLYDDLTDKFVDITLNDDDMNQHYAYGGMINKDINDEIKTMDTKRGLHKFLLGKIWDTGAAYRGYEDLESTPKLGQHKSKGEDNFTIAMDNINNNPRYDNLNKYLQNNAHIESVTDLEELVFKIDRYIDNIKNVKEYDYYTKLTKQIEGLIRLIKKG